MITSRKPVFKAYVVGVAMMLSVAAGCDKKLTDDGPDFTSNLVHYFPFSGNGTDEVSGNEYDLHGVTFLSDRKGKDASAAFFNGDIGWMDVSAGLEQEQGTLSFWIFPCLCKENNPLFVKKSIESDPYFGQYYIGYSEEGKVQTSCRGKWNAETDIVIEANKWFHLVVRWDDASGVTDIFVNGKKVHSEEYSVDQSALPDESAPAYVGKIHSQREGGVSTVFYKGKLDEIRFYNEWLPYSEIKKLYAE